MVRLILTFSLPCSHSPSSNSIEAIKNYKSFRDEDDNHQKTENNYIKVTPFMFDKMSRDGETTFEVFYIDNAENSGRTYQYGFALKKDEVVEEWLYSKAKTSRKSYKTIFYRKKGEELEMNGFTKNHIENIKASLNKETLIVSLGAKLRIAKLKKVRDWFMNNSVLDFGDPAENFFRSRVLPKDFIVNKEIQKEDGNKVRRDEALSKKYLTGSYGAIPALKPLKMMTGRTTDDE